VGYGFSEGWRFFWIFQGMVPENFVGFFEICIHFMILDNRIYFQIVINSLLWMKAYDIPKNLFVILPTSLLR